MPGSAPEKIALELELQPHLLSEMFFKRVLATASFKPYGVPEPYGPDYGKPIVNQYFMNEV